MLRLYFTVYPSSHHNTDTGLTFSNRNTQVTKKVAPMKLINPAVNSSGDSFVDMIKVLLSIVSLMLGFLLKSDNALLWGSVLGFHGPNLTDIKLVGQTIVGSSIALLYGGLEDNNSL